MPGKTISVSVRVGWEEATFSWLVPPVLCDPVQDEILDQAISDMAAALFLVALGKIDLFSQRDRLPALPDPRGAVSVAVDDDESCLSFFLAGVAGKSLFVPPLLTAVRAHALTCYHIACGDLDTDAAAMDDPHDDPDLAEIPKGADYGTS